MVSVFKLHETIILHLQHILRYVWSFVSVPSEDSDIECQEDNYTKDSFDITSCCVTDCPTEQFFNWSFKSWVVINWVEATLGGINTLSQLSCKWCNQCSWKKEEWQEKASKMIIRSIYHVLQPTRLRVTPIAMIPASGKIPFDFRKEALLRSTWLVQVRSHKPRFQHDQR